MRGVLMSAFAVVLVSGCSFVLDFDDLEDLPCFSEPGGVPQCDPDYVCLEASNKCVLRGTVDLFKSCPTDTTLNGDELCPTPNDICVGVNDVGPRCLPKCTPPNYGVATAGVRVQAECPPGTTCFNTGRGGVCSEGVCQGITDCPPTQNCASFNGAGICFENCEIFQVDPFACSLGQVCHPIGTESIAACVDSGVRQRGEICSDTDMCAKTDGVNPGQGRQMACAKPQGSSSAQLRCWPICIPGNGSRCNGAAGESCLLARPRIDPITQADLGVCATGT